MISRRNPPQSLVVLATGIAIQAGKFTAQPQTRQRLLGTPGDFFNGFIALVADRPAEPLGESHSGGAPSRTKRSAAIRTTALVIAIVPLGLLAVASQLEPSSQGLGTHQQLGLPPCTMRFLFGIRCPGCGMTTSWSHFTRGQWAQSAAVNTGGFLLAWLSLAVAGVAFRTAWTTRPPTIQTQKILTLTILAIAIVTLTQWVIRVLS